MWLLLKTLSEHLRFVFDPLLLRFNQQIPTVQEGKRLGKNNSNYLSETRCFSSFLRSKWNHICLTERPSTNLIKHLIKVLENIF
jgi:hypothetical protein